MSQESAYIQDWVSRKIKRLGITPTDKIGRVNYYTPKDADHIASYLFRLVVNDKAGAQRALAGESSKLINFDHDPDKTRITRLTDRVNSLTERLTDSDSKNDELNAANESLKAQNDQFQIRLRQAINDRNAIQLQLDQAVKTIDKLTALDDQFNELKNIMLGRGQRHKTDIN